MGGGDSIKSLEKQRVWPTILIHAPHFYSPGHAPTLHHSIELIKEAMAELRIQGGGKELAAFLKRFTNFKEEIFRWKFPLKNSVNFPTSILHDETVVL